MTGWRITQGRGPALRLAALALAPLALVACATATDPLRTGPDGFIAELPDEVAALAAAGQDLSRVRVRADDRCFWYLHAGPVEDTMIPLRTPRGNPICAPSTDPG
mgnify:CR=1 FL=1